MGLSLIVLGGVSTISATTRYLRLARQLDEGTYKSSTLGPVVVGAITFLVALAGVLFVTL